MALRHEPSVGGAWGQPESRTCRWSIMMLSITPRQWTQTGCQGGTLEQATHHKKNQQRNRGPHWLPQSIQVQQRNSVTLTNQLASSQPRKSCLSHTNPDLRPTAASQSSSLTQPPRRTLVPGGGASAPSFSSSKVPLLPSHSTGAQRKVEPVAKYAKKEGS